ncbi:TPA: hypothetical protein DDZ10_02135 [Candidatus Uhrbacteria bacterium]|uniref:Uncharacterized protein n=1 Tax=Candidatus Uhrbacteria bacterium GW2011_GWC2_53_7 TaxID=1618986 RepID=A0A0G2AVR4_9BACT|nr:MAG: hypothetical protein UY79_C0003G0066 [Parcubacteria group bacterium GW2011_GWA2_53_21]KKW36999.1 MAG: hypothetical protein UY82_C0005G0009 [Candidatus Uhrbacteria bacterium GW2011_GWC2_53_7]OGL72160.1 MAG: hypothetical protein A3D69_01295 [Candidatus Uhrbacteria bacterium RIFCSPHIGHO2_02_FULL_54_11]HBL39448.1 hypothetical protein [Candidatus Uhrbacteria bacterium]
MQIEEMDDINHEIKPKEKTISIKLPSLKLPSLQAGVLILLIVVGVLQTAQLYGLNLQIRSGQANAGSTTTVSSPAGEVGSTTSTLPSMVGGC